jgi:flagellar biosynthesis protein FliQ
MVGVVLALLIALPWMMKLMLHYAGTLFGGLGAFA